MTSDSFSALLDRNRSFAEQFEAGDLTIRPRMSTIILTCVDARVDPAHLFGLGLGDAIVIRNAGGRITRAVMGDLGILSVLAANMPGPSAMQPELVVIHHTDCGLSRLANPAIQEQVAERLGLGHVAWVPLLLFLWTRLGSAPADEPLGLWIRGVIALNAISLVIDASDVIRWLAGERGETVEIASARPAR